MEQQNQSCRSIGYSEMLRYSPEYDIEVYNYDNDIWHEEASGLTRQEADNLVTEIRANYPTMSIRITERIIDTGRKDLTDYFYDSIDITSLYSTAIRLGLSNSEYMSREDLIAYIKGRI